MSTRRTFLKASAVIATALPLARWPLGAAETGGANPAGAPTQKGLLFAPSDLPRIRANLELPRLADIRGQLLNVDFAADTKFLREELRLNNHVADFLRAGRIVERSAFAFAVWGDPRQLDLALLALRRLCDYKRWDYFLEGGKHTIGLQRAPEATIACCYALDWLGDKVPAELVTAVEAKIAGEGAPACYRTLYGMKFPDRVQGWGFDPEDDYQFRFDLSRWPLILNSTNLKIIPTCGLGLAAVWLQGRHPGAQKWLEMSRQSAQAFATMYGADGSFDEGVGYWGYTTSHLAMLAEAIYRRLGLDDRKLINYPGTVRYALAMAMPCAAEPIDRKNPATAQNTAPKSGYEPTFDVVNFCDAATRIDASIAAWVGGTANDPLSRHVAKHVGALRMIQAAAWYQPDAETLAPTAALHDVRMSNDWVVTRTGWKPADTVIAFRSGGPGNHEHADRNSVIFKAHGERLFHDPFGAGYSATLPRWLLRQTEAHTAVLINGKGHQYHDGREGTNASWSHARVTSFKTGPQWTLVTSDATEAYQLVNPDVQLVERTLLFLKPDVLIVLDRVKLATAQPMQARFQAFNDDGRATTRADGASFRIARPLAHTEATVHTVANTLTCAAGQLALPAAEGVFPFIEVVSAAATVHELLTVCTAAPTGAAASKLNVRRTGDAWQITGTHLGRAVTTTLTTIAGKIPAV